ncbi:hypothetical protein [Campylobacter jejuni]|uniref:hypothetical protein n=1 Tax=Campylobacter jejuni TaxID=197 RepID=UPI000AE8DD43|nr:hypothetical protein [Campylobacter jejuni]
MELFNKNNILTNLSSGKPVFVDVELLNLPQKLFHKACKAGYYDDCNIAINKHSKDETLRLYLLKLHKNPIKTNVKFQITNNLLATKHQLFQKIF